MAEVTSPKSALVSRLKGLHLFGFDGAPCSQRVGFALAEKGLVRQCKVPFRDTSPSALTAADNRYVMREVSLIKHDNMSPEYAAIQPNLVIPALVHDGRLWIESMDIIDQLDQLFPSPALMPADQETRQLALQLIDQGKALHISIRHVTFNWSLGNFGKTDAKTEAMMNDLQSADSPEQLAQFYARFNSGQIEAREFNEHLAKLEEAYSQCETRLKSDNRPFLTGNQFTTADIIWGIKVLRLVECGYPFKKNFPALHAWYQRVSRRRGFRQGVIGHNRLFHHAFKLKAGIENLFGKGVRASSQVSHNAEPEGAMMSTRMTVGIYLFDNMTMLDAYAPLQMLAMVEQFETITFTSTEDPVRSDSGTLLVADHSLASCPPLDVLVMPGGGDVLPQMLDQELQSWLRSNGPKMRYVTSVCTGALILAEAGLLNGYQATTHWGWVDQLRDYPEIEVVDRRVVVDRDRISGGGVTAGIDFALTLIAELVDRTTAETLQLVLEYRPSPPFDSGSPQAAPAEVAAGVSQMIGERKAALKQHTELKRAG